MFTLIYKIHDDDDYYIWNGSMKWCTQNMAVHADGSMDRNGTELKRVYIDNEVKEARSCSCNTYLQGPLWMYSFCGLVGVAYIVLSYILLMRIAVIQMTYCREFNHFELNLSWIKSDEVWDFFFISRLQRRFLWRN